jgi:flagellar biosynthesis protein FlhF
MLVRKFYAESAREALRMVRDALGPGAMILSNRTTAAGVELTAAPEAELTSVTARATRQSTPIVTPVAVEQSKPAPAAEEGAEVEGYSLVQEVRFLRTLVEGQLAAFAWSDLARTDPAKAEVMRQLLAAGFTPSSARQLVAHIAPGLDAGRALRVLKLRLQQKLAVIPPEQSIVDQGGVYALVGPTGVGKTTTVAKIAAECTLRLGARHVALVTTDTYRIGAVDQLRIYGRILGAPVFAIRGEADFAHALTELRARHLVLIDTVGMSQRDRRVAEQVALLAGAGRRVRRLLLLAAVAQPNVLEDVVRAYRGEDLAGCILTKVDETLTLGGALDVLIRHRLPLHYIANGQRVPEDLHRPNPLYLVERAFRPAAGAAVPTTREDFPLVYAAGTSAPLAPSPASIT